MRSIVKLAVLLLSYDAAQAQYAPPYVAQPRDAAPYRDRADMPLPRCIQYGCGPRQPDLYGEYHRWLQTNGRRRN